MSLTVEDGTIVSGAESYITVAAADTYHSGRGNSAWSGTDAVKEAALRKAAAYLDGEYRKRWKGWKVDPEAQQMEWPRSGVCLSDDCGQSAWFLSNDFIHPRLQEAQCELALRALSGDLAPDYNGSVIRERVDVLETEYAAGSGPGRKTYQLVDMLLSDLLKPKGSVEAMRG